MTSIRADIIITASKNINNKIMSEEQNINEPQSPAFLQGDVSRSSFFQYLKNLIEIHGEQSFGVYESTTENTNGDQKITLCCWGCEAKGYMLWSESWKKHFEHQKDCEFTKLMLEVQNCG